MPHLNSSIRISIAQRLAVVFVSNISSLSYIVVNGVYSELNYSSLGVLLDSSLDCNDSSIDKNQNCIHYYKQLTMSKITRKDQVIETTIFTWCDTQIPCCL